MNHDGNMHGGGDASANGTTAAMNPHRRHMMMHMTFFWGKNTEILFPNWPGHDNLGMYVLALAIVFLTAVVVEWLSHCRVFVTRPSSYWRSLSQTALYAVRIGLAYMVMLAVMSFNAGVFLVAVAGHGLGFFLFGSRRAFANKDDNNGGMMNHC